MTIATNNSLMLLRKRRNRPESRGLITAEGKELEFFALSDPTPNPEQVCSKRQVSQKLCHAISKLPSSFRLLVQHYYQDEIKLVDAANAMGITPAAAKSRLLRARNMLRRHLKTS